MNGDKIVRSGPNDVNATECGRSETEIRAVRPHKAKLLRLSATKSLYGALNNA